MCARTAQFDVFPGVEIGSDNAAMTARLPEPMPAQLTPWQARLELDFVRRAERTVLAGRRHQGPLRVQKALYPEGPGVCQVLVLHPPSGIAGGDELSLAVDLAAGAHSLLTTPGAGKWYRSAGPWARQALDFRVAENAALEWLPQETIVFDGARGRLESRVRLAPGARYLGWEILCLGRRASGERFDRGELRLDTRIERAGGTIWLERGRLAGGDPLLESPAGLDGFSVCATLLAAGATAGAELLAACRAVASADTAAKHGITTMDDLLVARYLGHSSEAARHWLTALWALLRPVLLGRDAVPPRIWNT
jgi:urease accessory protein